MTRPGILGKIIPGFPYPERFCKHCESEMVLQTAAHYGKAEEYFKAVFYCLNLDCPALNEELRKCYMLVYYSDQKAYEAFFDLPVWMPERKLR